jgi:hypothetical protein
MLSRRNVSIVKSVILQPIGQANTFLHPCTVSFCNSSLGIVRFVSIAGFKVARVGYVGDVGAILASPVFVSKLQCYRYREHEDQFAANLGTLLTPPIKSL